MSSFRTIYREVDGKCDWGAPVVLMTNRHTLCARDRQNLEWDQVLSDAWKNEYVQYYAADRDDETAQWVRSAIYSMYPGNDHPRTVGDLYELWSYLDNAIYGSV